MQLALILYLVMSYQFSVSPIYENRALGMAELEDFLNACEVDMITTYWVYRSLSSCGVRAGRVRGKECGTTYH